MIAQRLCHYHCFSWPRCGRRRRCPPQQTRRNGQRTLNSLNASQTRTGAMERNGISAPATIVFWLPLLFWLFILPHYAYSIAIHFHRPGLYGRQRKSPSFHQWINQLQGRPLVVFWGKEGKFVLDDLTSNFISFPFSFSHYNPSLSGPCSGGDDSGSDLLSQAILRSSTRRLSHKLKSLFRFQNLL